MNTIKIAVLSDRQQRSEMLSRTNVRGIEWIWVDSISQLIGIENAAAYFDLHFTNEKKRIDSLAGLLPAPVVVNAVPYSLVEIGQPFFRLNAWPGFLSRTLLEVAVFEPASEIAATKLFDSLQWARRFVPDLPGMITPKIISMVINEAYYTFGAGISTKKDIDLAMKLGTNYPYGPFEWADKIGLSRIYELLNALSKIHPRYTISESLKKEMKEMDNTVIKK